jgi:hypothetical protein
MLPPPREIAGIVVLRPDELSIAFFTNLAQD